MIWSHREFSATTALTDDANSRNQRRVYREGIAGRHKRDIQKRRKINRTQNFYCGIFTIASVSDGYVAAILASVLTVDGVLDGAS